MNVLILRNFTLMLKNTILIDIINTQQKQLHQERMSLC